jgi:hypothetical protein
MGAAPAGDAPEGDAPAGGASWRPILLLAVIVPLLLGLVMVLRAGGGLRVEPDIDWSAYPPSVHDAIDGAAKNADCAGLAEQRAAALTTTDPAGDPSPLVVYIDSIRRQLVCPG